MKAKLLVLFLLLSIGSSLSVSGMKVFSADAAEKGKESLLI